VGGYHPSVFYLLSKLLDLLLSPLTWALVLVVASIAWRRRRAAPWLAAAAVTVLWVFAVEPVADGLTGLAERGVRSTMRPGVTYDAAIVLGGGIDPGASCESGEPELNPAGDRMVAGFELFRAGRVRNLLLSAGGPDASEPVEADFGALLYRRLGVPPERIVVERDSRNTRENAERSADIVRQRGWSSLLLVTSAMHMPRAAAAFRRVGLTFDVLPVDRRYGRRPWTVLPRTEVLDRSTWALRELAGRLVYRAMGYGGS
jgi:uncharacterized SAM-binding protein YcdF (DUF218 family)